MKTLLLMILLCVTPTFDQGDAYHEPMWGDSNTITYHLFKKPVKHNEGSNRLLVITEPKWCAPCRRLDPILKKLKAEGYDVHEYSQEEWFHATNKPKSMPKQLANAKSPRDFSVPTLLFVDRSGKNNVLHWATGYRSEKYITTRLAKEK